MKIKVKDKNIEVKNLIEVSFLGMFKGLMFSKREHANALLFDMKNPCNKSIHSLFVFFPFLAIWLDNEKIIDMKIVKPFCFRIKPPKKFSKLIEIPMNNKYKKTVQLLVGEKKTLKR